MKIKKNHNAEVSRLFAQRANPWAPKYEPALWNDASQTAFEMNMKRYEEHLNRIGAVLGDKLDRPHKMATLMRHFDDQLLQRLTDAPLPELGVMRKNFMRLLNSTCMSTNCYAYALNIRHGFKPGDLLTPGSRHAVGGECSVPMNGYNLTVLFDGLAKDGIQTFAGDPNRDLPPAGFYLVALLVRMAENNPDALRDFHFIRYDRDGGCSHKPGHDYVSRSYMGREIIDPTQPNTMPFYRHVATLQVPAVL